MPMNANKTHRLVMLQHELLMALGSSSEPDEILEKFTMRAIKALNLRCIYIIQNENPAVGMEKCQHRIPFIAAEIETHPHLAKYLDAGIPSVNRFLEDSERDKHYWYCFAVKNLGYMILERTGKPFDEALVAALSAPISRFGQIYVDRMLFLLNDKHRNQIKTISENLQAEKTKLEHILNAISDSVLVLDVDGMVYFTNPAGGRLLGIEGSAQPTDHFTKYFRILDSDNSQDITREIVDTCETDGHWFYEKPVILSTVDNRMLVVRLNVQNMAKMLDTKLSDGTYFVCTFHDITDAHKLEQELKWRASHDPLTQAYNRRGFEDKISELVAASRNHGSALICMDLDRFKHVNDIGGHPAGDALLQQVTTLMQHEIRKNDVLARVGGDEFCVILKRCNINIALKIAERIRNSIDRLRFHWEGNIFTIGISLGITEIKPEETDSDAIFLRADEACLDSKENGRNQVTLAESSKSKEGGVQGHMNYLNCINRALLSSDDEYQLVLYKQAILPVSNFNRKPHQEVLLRISHQGKLVPPNAFLPAAERSGKVSDIDLWVLENTLKYLRTNKEYMLNVNISGVTLSADNSRAMLFDLICEYPTEAKLLCLEITETSAIINLSKCIAFMEKLNYLGVCFALDDFGTGVSSFGYLKNLPVKYLKIDGSFIRDICDNEIDAIMVQSIISAAKAMKISTVAEYVSNPDILAKVTELGADFAQGYCLSEPQPLEAEYSFASHRVKGFLANTP